MNIISSYDLEHELDIDSKSIWLINTTPPSLQKNLISVQEIGEFYAYRNYYTTRKEIDSYLIKITLDGAGVLNYDGQISIIPEGHFYWIDCHDWHDYRTDRSAGHWHVMWLHFFGGNSRFYYESFLNYNNGSNVGSLRSDSVVYQIMQQLFDITKYDTISPDMYFKSSSLITAMLTDIIESRIVNSNSPVFPPLLVSVRQYINDNYRRTISLQELSKLHNLSPCYLQRLFKRYFGLSPLEYQQNLRIDKSKAELQHTDKSISEIAYDIGFESLNYYSRLFKKCEGKTPGEYRKQWTGQKAR